MRACGADLRRCSPELTFGGLVPLAGFWELGGGAALALYHPSTGTFLLFAAGAGCQQVAEVALDGAAGDDLHPTSGYWRRRFPP